MHPPPEVRAGSNSALASGGGWGQAAGLFCGTRPPRGVKTLGAGTLYPDAHSRRSDAPRVSNWRGFTCPVREARGARVPRSCKPLPYPLTTRVPRPRAQTFPLFAPKFGLAAQVGLRRTRTPTEPEVNVTGQLEAPQFR